MNTAWSLLVSPRACFMVSSRDGVLCVKRDDVGQRRHLTVAAVICDGKETEMTDSHHLGFLPTSQRRMPLSRLRRFPNRSLHALSFVSGIVTLPLQCPVLSEWHLKCLNMLLAH